MSEYQYQSGKLCCEQVALEEIARDVGTPFYVYSHRALSRSFETFVRAFSAVPCLIAFAIKSCPNLAILRILANAGAGGDVVSVGELLRARKAGIKPEKLVFAGVGKTTDEMRAALDAGILMFCVESPLELMTLNKIAGELGRHAPVALRVNPDIDPRTHPYISTGLKENKFGMSAEQAIAEFATARELPHVDVVGIHSHIGSQITELAPLESALEKVLELILGLRASGIDISHWDIGGGFGIRYHEETPPSVDEMARALIPLLEQSDCQIVLEPGRSIAATAGALVTRVLYTKETEEKKFVIVDAGMTELMRPILYGAWHGILPVHETDRPSEVVDVVGPVCESGDFLARERTLPESRPGDLLGVMDAGAYGFAMASNYNARPRPPEVLINGNRYDVVRTRETLEDLLRGETIPDYLGAH